MSNAYQKISIKNRERKFLLHVPQGYQQGTPTPLVISIHGFADWPARQQKMSRWNDLADRDQFIVVYPRGTGIPLRWNTGSGNSQNLTPDDEVLFFSMLIDDLSAKYTIDPNRIYVNGFSNGGGMALLLACSLSERIAAVGCVAAAITPRVEYCTASQPVPTIIFHGTADPIVPYHGGRTSLFHREFPDIPEWVKHRASYYGCSREQNQLPVMGEVTGLEYSSENPDAHIQFYTIVDGGHAWPGGLPLPGAIVGHTTQDMDATKVMWGFFCKHRFLNPPDLSDS